MMFKPLLITFALVVCVVSTAQAEKKGWPPGLGLFRRTPTVTLVDRFNADGPSNLNRVNVLTVARYHTLLSQSVEELAALSNQGSAQAAQAFGAHNVRVLLQTMVRDLKPRPDIFKPTPVDQLLTQTLSHLPNREAVTSRYNYYQIEFAKAFPETTDEELEILNQNGLALLNLLNILHFVTPLANSQPVWEKTDTLLFTLAMKKMIWLDQRIKRHMWSHPDQAITFTRILLESAVQNADSSETDTLAELIRETNKRTPPDVVANRAVQNWMGQHLIPFSRAGELARKVTTNSIFLGFGLIATGGVLKAALPITSHTQESISGVIATVGSVGSTSLSLWVLFSLLHGTDRAKNMAWRLVNRDRTDLMSEAYQKALTCRDRFRDEDTLPPASGE